MDHLVSLRTWIERGQRHPLITTARELALDDEAFNDLRLFMAFDEGERAVEDNDRAAPADAPDRLAALMIDWSKCPEAERIPGKLSGAWYLKGHRIRCEDIIGQFDAGCTAEEIAGPDIYDLPLDLVRRILAFAGPRVAGAS